MTVTGEIMGWSIMAVEEYRGLQEGKTCGAAGGVRCARSGASCYAV